MKRSEKRWERRGMDIEVSIKGSHGTGCIESLTRTTQVGCNSEFAAGSKADNASSDIDYVATHAPSKGRCPWIQTNHYQLKVWKQFDSQRASQKDDTQSDRSCGHGKNDQTGQALKIVITPA